MRITAPMILICALPGLALLSACTTTPASGSAEIQTTGQANRESLQGVVASPLRDVNLLRTKIPEVLLTALKDPYARPRPATCANLQALLLPLNGALGSDLDEIDIDQNGLMEQGRDSAMGWMASAAQSVIPLRGWVRKLSGAERHDSLVTQAITAGAVRRAYLKGLGEAKACNPPALPQHKASDPAPPPEPEAAPRKPRSRSPVR